MPFEGLPDAVDRWDIMTLGNSFTLDEQHQRMVATVHQRKREPCPPRTGGPDRL